jgi:ketosteroid isomerase-like protein
MSEHRSAFSADATCRTQMHLARAGAISPEMQRVAAREGLAADLVRDEVARGRMVIPANVHHERLDPMAIGLAARVKINATKRDDFSLMRELVAEDAVLYADGTSPLGGTHRGRENAFANFPRLHALSGETLTLEITEIIVDEFCVVMLNRATAERDGVPLDVMIAVIWRFVDGRCVEIWDHFSDVGTWDAFWRADYAAMRAAESTAAVDGEEIRGTVEAITKNGDNQLLERFFAPRVISHVDGSSPIGGDHDGRDDVLAGFGKIHALAEGRLSVEAEQVAVNEDFAVIFNRVRAQRGDDSIEHLLITTWRIEGGEVVEIWTHFKDVSAWDEFWA